MKLLIVTQTVDENDPILGFFCGWVSAYATHFESIAVIALSVGANHLPKNVTVHSLGKNEGVSRIGRFFKYVGLLFSLHTEYTHVFVHMNPEYVIYGCWVWMLFRKKTALWYNHSKKSLRLTAAAHMVRAIFYTSPFAASSQFPGAKQMPAGIDTSIFKPESLAKNRNEIYFQGRITAAKRVADICRAFRSVLKNNSQALLTLVGPVDASYGEYLQSEFGDLVSAGSIVIHGPRKSSDTPTLYSHAGVSVNLTAAGNYDKTVLESMACETPVIVSSAAFADIIPKEWIVPENNPEALAQKILENSALSEADYRALGTQLRTHVEQKHSLTKLAFEVFYAMKSL